MNLTPTVCPSRPAARRAERGFTLVEIMVVVVILGLLVAIVVPNIMGSSDKAKEQIAHANAVNIAQQVKMYYVNNGKLPSTLSVLAEKDEKGRSLLEELPKDPWGNDYELKPGDRRDDWEVFSWGPDGSAGTEDDISHRTKKDQ